MARVSSLLGFALFAMSGFQVALGASTGALQGPLAKAAAAGLGAPLPLPWLDADIGSPAIAGSATYDAGTFTVNGSGTDIEASSDQFHYVYQPVSGDVTVIARVVSIQNTDPWAKGGVMIRESLAADSAHAMTVVTPGNGVAFQRRLATGAGTTTTLGAAVAAPYWVMIVRSGNVLRGYSSADGAAWNLVGSDTVTMDGNVLVGLPVTSHNDTTLNTSLFDNVSVTPSGCAVANILIDGSFEATNPETLANPNWSASSTQFNTPLCGTGGCGARTGPAAPRSGTFWAFFGGSAGTLAETASLSQAVTFPAGASVVLNFYLWVSTVTAPFTDTLELQVDGVTQQSYTEPATADFGYALRSVDLTSFADGASHTVNFLYTQPLEGGNSNFNVDDASMDVTCPAQTTPSPISLALDPVVNNNSNGNGVLEMNEDAIVDPGWHNDGAVDFTLTGTASNLTGPGTGVFTILDPDADYGLITAGTSKDCLSGTPNCYVINISGLRTDQPVHFDATIDETVVPSLLSSPTLVAKTWTLHVGNSFSDVSTDLVADPFYPSIETIFHNGVTGGCGDGTTYCPLQNVLRQQMAVFLLKSLLGASYVPPACTPPGVFTDVPCPGPFTDWIEDLSARNITGGCGDGSTYCPTQDVLRQQMAVFLLKSLLGASYVPPACTPPGVFTDVPCPGPFTDWIEDLKARGITAGCGDGTIFCPTSSVTRQEMAAFLTRTFSLVLYGP